VIGHLRDPYHRVDAHPSTRPVVVRVDGEEVARSERPVLVLETALPVRAYVPPADVRPGTVVAGSGLRSICAYESPLPDALRAQGHLAFDDSKPEVEVELG